MVFLSAPVAGDRPQAGTQWASGGPGYFGTGQPLCGQLRLLVQRLCQTPSGRDGAFELLLGFSAASDAAPGAVTSASASAHACRSTGWDGVGRGGNSLRGLVCGHAVPPSRHPPQNFGAIDDSFWSEHECQAGWVGKSPEKTPWLREWDWDRLTLRPPFLWGKGGGGRVPARLLTSFMSLSFAYVPDRGAIPQVLSSPRCDASSELDLEKLYCSCSRVGKTAVYVCSLGLPTFKSGSSRR